MDGTGRIAPASKPADVMVIGAGPAASRQHVPWANAVTVYNCSTHAPEVGGRVTREALLPGWARGDGSWSGVVARSQSCRASRSFQPHR